MVKNRILVTSDDYGTIWAPRRDMEIIAAIDVK